jgi:hypothetical protein
VQVNKPWGPGSHKKSAVICVISKLHVHKLLEIKLLQNMSYGRLSVDGALALEDDRRFENLNSAIPATIFSFNGRLLPPRCRKLIKPRL